ncbi:hypothetical protein pb186bvf_005377 [Paramecium bursaria]
MQGYAKQAVIISQSLPKPQELKFELRKPGVSQQINELNLGLVKLIMDIGKFTNTSITKQVTYDQIEETIETLLVNASLATDKSNFKPLPQPEQQVDVKKKPKDVYGIYQQLNKYPFVPILKEKYFYIKPLDYKILDAQNDIERFFEENDIQEFEHPYFDEIETLTFSNQMLAPPQEIKHFRRIEDPIIINTVDQLSELVFQIQNDLDEKGEIEIAVDLEHHSQHSYLGLTCLIQLSTREQDYIIDPFPIWNWVGQILGCVFANPKIVKILHGADNDILWLQRDFGIYIVNLFDTHIASKELKFPQHSYASLVFEYCKISLDKQYQLEDWSVRPISGPMIEYAQKDTHYLHYIYDRLKKDLLNQDSIDNVFQRSKRICQTVYRKPEQDQEISLQLFLDKQQRRIDIPLHERLIKIFEWREEIGFKYDENPRFFLTNSQVLRLAESCPNTIVDLKYQLGGDKNIPYFLRENLGQLLLILIQSQVSKTKAKVQKVYTVNKPLEIIEAPITINPIIIKKIEIARKEYVTELDCLFQHEDQVEDTWLIKGDYNCKSSFKLLNQFHEGLGLQIFQTMHYSSKESNQQIIRKEQQLIRLETDDFISFPKELTYQPTKQTEIPLQSLESMHDLLCKKREFNNKKKSPDIQVDILQNFLNHYSNHENVLGKWKMLHDFQIEIFIFFLKKRLKFRPLMIQLLFEYRTQFKTDRKIGKVQLISTFLIMILSSLRMYVQHNYRYSEMMNELSIQADKDGDKNYSILKLIDILSLLQQNKLTFNIIVIMSSLIIIAIPIVMLVIYAQRKLNPQSKPFNSVHGKILHFLILCLAWFLYYPCQYFILLTFNCQRINEIVNCRDYQTIYGLQFALAIFAQIILIGMNLFQPFLLNDSFQKYDSLNCDYRFGLLLFNLYRSILGLLNTFYLYNYQIVIQLMQMILAIGLYHTLYYSSYIVIQHQLTFMFLLLLQLCVFSGTAVHELTRLYYGDYNDDSLYFIILLCIFCLKMHLHLMEEEKSKLIRNCTEFSQIKRRITLFQQFINEGDYSTHQTSIYWSLIICHLQNKCNRKISKVMQYNCFCSLTKIYYAKRREEYNTHERSLFINQKIYSKFIQKLWIEEYLNNNPQDVEALLYHGKFLFYKLRLVWKSLYLVKKVYCKNMYIMKDKHVLEKIIHEYAQKCNKDSYNQNLEFENVLIVENIVRNTQQLMTQILHLNVRYWRNLAKPLILEDDIISIYLMVESKIKECNSWWNLIKNQGSSDKNSQFYLNKRFQWLFQYCWYQLFITNKPLSQALLDMLPSSNPNIEQIFKDEDITDDSEDERDENAYKDSNINKPFNKKTAIIHAVQDKFLKITQVNSSFTNVFGFYAEEMIDQPIDKLLPQCLARNHNQNIKNFMQRGTDYCFYNKRLIFGIHKDGYLFRCSKYLKFIVNIHNQFEYICMIRPITIETHYIIFNQEWEIQSISEKLGQILKIRNLPLFLLCPKLLEYSIYQNFLQFSDLNIFDLNYKKKSKVHISEMPLSSLNIATQNLSLEDRDPDSLVFKQNGAIATKHDTEQVDELDSQNINLILEEDYVGQMFQLKKVYRLTDVSHIQLTIRIPSKIDELRQAYLSSKQLNQSYPMPPLFEPIVQKDQQGRLEIVKSRLMRQLAVTKQIYTEKMLENLRTLFCKYMKRRMQLSGVLKMDVNMEFPSKRCFDKLIIVRVNKFDFHENIKSTDTRITVVLGEPAPLPVQTVYTEYPTFTTRQQTQIQFETNRTTNISKSLIDSNIIIDAQMRPQSINIKKEENPFLKYDNNKSLKHSKYLLIFTTFTRVVMISYIICSIIIYLYGFKHYIYPKISSLGPAQMQTLVLALNQICQSYDMSLDLSLYNTGLLDGIIFNQQITKFQNEDQYFSYFLNQLEERINYVQQIKSETDFIRTFYTKSHNYNSSYSGLDLFNQYSNNLLRIKKLKSLKQFQRDDISLLYYRALMIPVIVQNYVVTITNIHEECVANLTSLELFLYYLLIIFLILAVLFIAFIVFSLLYINTKVQLIYYQIAIIDRKAVSDLLSYQQQLEQTFAYFVSYDKIEQQRFIINEYLSKNKQDGLSSKTSQYKSTKVIRSKYWKTKQLKDILIYLFFYCLLITGPFTQYFTLKLQINGLQDILSKNTFITNYDQFWILPILKDTFIYQNISTTQIPYPLYVKYLFQFNAKTQDPNQYSYQTRIESITNMFYKNVCNQLSNYQQQNDQDIYYCNNLLNQALNRGIMQYNNLLSQQIYGLTNDTRFQQINLQTIQEMTTLNQYVIKGYLQIWDIWVILFQDQAISINQIELNLFLYSFINIIFFYMCIEYVLFRQMNLDYKKARRFYEQYMPNEVMNTEKRIRIELMRCCLIKK